MEPTIKAVVVHEAASLLGRLLEFTVQQLRVEAPQV
jgi:hypothetical protein